MSAESCGFVLHRVHHVHEKRKCQVRQRKNDLQLLVRRFGRRAQRQRDRNGAAEQRHLSQTPHDFLPVPSKTGAAGKLNFAAGPVNLVTARGSASRSGPPSRSSLPARRKLAASATDLTMTATPAENLVELPGSGARRGLSRRQTHLRSRPIACGADRTDNSCNLQPLARPPFSRILNRLSSPATFHRICTSYSCVIQL